MNKIIVLLSISFVLSACGAIPKTMDARGHGTGGIVESATGETSKTTEVQAAATESGLGTIAAHGNTRTQPCSKQRRTGSHLYRVGCEDPDSGSQPVRYGTWNDLGKYAMSGSVRPEN